ncbi:MAG: hypothetical protein HYZ69_00520 [Candidatus Colwellbacteria bacterium]|nr:hypothetical protein [Candidatus Colwellbacteria bacterium]
MTKICQNRNEQFTIDPTDLAFYEKMHVPPPTFCPLCRAQRRLAFYNLRTLYKRPDTRTGKEIFSSFSPAAPFVVYDKDYWWSDAWDPLDYGREYDFSKPFFEQFFALFKKVPLASRSVLNPVRSDFSNNAGNLKDCYLVFDATECENCLYGSSMNNTKDSIDVSDVTQIEHSYETLMSSKSSNLFFSSQCDNCFEVYFSRDLAGCNY